MVIFFISRLILFFSNWIMPQFKNIWADDPDSPNLPPFFCNIVLILDADLFLLSVRVSMINAALDGPNPSYLKFS